MKATILALTTMALAGSGLQNAAAGDHEWATAGKVLTGVLAGTVLVKAIEGHCADRCPPPTYYVAPAPVVQPAAVVVTAPTPVVMPRPVVVVAPPPPAPVYYAPTYYVAPAPAPVVVAAPPTVVYVPRPMISVSIGIGGRPYYCARPHRRRW